MMAKLSNPTPFGSRDVKRWKILFPTGSGRSPRTVIEAPTKERAKELAISEGYPSHVTVARLTKADYKRHQQFSARRRAGTLGFQRGQRRHGKPNPEEYQGHPSYDHWNTAGYVANVADLYEAGLSMSRAAFAKWLPKNTPTIGATRVTPALAGYAWDELAGDRRSRNPGGKWVTVHYDGEPWRIRYTKPGERFDSFRAQWFNTVTGKWENAKDRDRRTLHEEYGIETRVRNPKDSITLRGRPANILADMSLAEVRRRNPELAADIDRAGGVSVVSVDAGGGAEPAMLALDGSIVPLDELDNTGVLEPAFAVSEEFHGRAPRYAQGFNERLEYAPVLTDLGRLVELGIYSQTSTGKPAETPLQFAAREGIQLATNPEKNQLFIVGGVNLDQRTLGRLGVDPSEFDKEKIMIGPVLNIVYHTRKKMHHFKATDYIHQLGEDDGAMPVLIYDRLNDQLELAGGTYTISERGIIN